MPFIGEGCRVGRMLVVGVDGCRGGWCAVSISDDVTLVDVHPNLKSVWRNHRNASSILVDIPIGLPDGKNATRACDEEARKRLPGRSSSVFPVPGRSATRCRTYEEACLVNQRETGLKVSKQAWYISDKIRQADELLRGDARARKVVREIHPELCFWAFNDERPMRFNKTRVEGGLERLELLRTFQPDIDVLLMKSINSLKGAGGDDIIDAFAAALTAKLCSTSGRWSTIPKEPERDDFGLPIEMVYYSTLEI